VGGQSQDGGDSSDDDPPRRPWLPEGFEFLSGLSDAARKRRLIFAVQQAFIDDSGTKGTHPVFVLAGFIGEAENWARLSEIWKQTLAASPSIKYLKMAEAAKPKGQFRGWSQKERNDKLAAFVEVLKQFPLKAIQVTIDIAAFQERQAPYLPKPQSDPYFMAMYSILGGVCYDVIDSGTGEKFEVIFDRQVIFEPRANLWYPVFREIWIEFENPELELLPSSLRFEDDKEFRPLQAADVLAWLFRMAYSGHRTEFEWIAEELGPHIPLSEYSAVFDRDRMNGILAKSFKYKFTQRAVERAKERLGLSHMSKTQFDKFMGLTDKILKVPHSVIKAKLDAEKAAKKRKKSKTSSASGRAADAKD
jgi:hypothetical protein